MVVTTIHITEDQNIWLDHNSYNCLRLVGKIFSKIINNKIIKEFLKILEINGIR